MDEHIAVQPLTGGGVNTTEYLLQGSVLDSSLDSLIARLRGVCDNLDPESFTDREAVWLLRVQGAPSLTLRSRTALDRPDYPHLLRYLGQAESGERARIATVRACVDVHVSESAHALLAHMGFTLDHEYTARGHVFRRGRVKVAVSKLCRLPQPGSPNPPEPLTASHLVEVTWAGPGGGEGGANAVRAMADLLRPLVSLERLDPKRL